MKFRLSACVRVCSSRIAGHRLHRRYTSLVSARSLKSWERFRPGFVGFGQLQRHLRAIIGSKVENMAKNGPKFFRADSFQMTFK